MRFIHTADWHIGRLFHNVSLVEDQAHVLEQLLVAVRETGARALVVAGDVYDRAVPPADAVRLLDDVLSRVTQGLGVPVVMIAGNHDSPDRLGFGAAMLERQDLHVRGPVRAHVAPVTLGDADGPVHFFPIPYVDPAVARAQLGEEGIRTHSDAMAAVTARIGGGGVQGRAVAVAHCFATGGEGCDSERPLSVGGAGNVDVGSFAGFDYTALGHLHRPQQVADRVRYSGSLLKYSFSEAAHHKSVSLVDLDASGNATVEQLPLTPRRDVRVLEGHLEALLEGPGPGESADDYLLVRLLDTRAILDPMGKLRTVYPNVLHLERPGLWQAGELREAGREQLARSEQALFGSFFEQMTGDALDEAEAAAFADVLEALRAAEREAAP